MHVSYCTCWTALKTLQWKWNQVYLHCISWYLRAQTPSLPPCSSSSRYSLCSQFYQWEKLRNSKQPLEKHSLEKPELKHKISLLIRHDHSNLLRNTRKRKTHTCCRFIASSTEVFKCLKRLRNPRKIGQLNIWGCLYFWVPQKWSGGNSEFSYCKTKRITDELTG